jgi:hypothetical protein
VAIEKLVHSKSFESSDIRLNPTFILDTHLSKNLPVASAKLPLGLAKTWDQLGRIATAFAASFTRVSKKLPLASASGSEYIAIRLQPNSQRETIK